MTTTILPVREFGLQLAQLFESLRPWRHLAAPMDTRSAKETSDILAKIDTDPEFLKKYGEDMAAYTDAFRGVTASVADLMRLAPSPESEPTEPGDWIVMFDQVSKAAAPEGKRASPHSILSYISSFGTAWAWIGQRLLESAVCTERWADAEVFADALLTHPDFVKDGDKDGLRIALAFVHRFRDNDVKAYTEAVNRIRSPGGLISHEASCLLKHTDTVSLDMLNNKPWRN